MNIGWRHYGVSPASGIARGYLTLSYHLHRCMRRLVAVVDCGPDGCHPRMVLHVAPPHLFEPVKRKVNVLFTMWEGEELPAEVAGAMARADALIVPSRWCRSVLRHSGLDAAVVQLGVPEDYLLLDPSRPIIRSAASPPLRFLWLGSRLTRKGWELIAPAWRMAFDGQPARVRLWLKTVGDGSLARHFGGDVVIDQRDLDSGAVMGLYTDADVFLFPSYGEGFGLPALEAMAAGCLVAAPASTGLSEFVGLATAAVIPRRAAATVHYGAEYVTALPAAEDVAKVLRVIHRFWGTPGLEALRMQGVRLARTMTWPASAAKLKLALEEAAQADLRSEIEPGRGPRAWGLTDLSPDRLQRPGDRPAMTGRA